jgi:release factor glutamine methyltransferase
VTILDIGTGSGCIAISLALEINNCKVAAMDISPEAIDCAKENSKVLDSPVSLIQADILNDDIPNQFDLIVSNPPYISEEEKGKMKPNVLEYEPHLALFGPKNNPLKFYNVIAEKGGQALKENGSIWVEINEHFGNEIKKIFENRNYKQVRIIKDLDNKDRIIAAFL